MEIKININAPGLETAINNLAAALGQANTIETLKSEDKPIKETPVKETPSNMEQAPKETPAKEEPVKETPAKVSPGIPFESVRAKLAELAQAGKQEQVKELITSFGAARISDVPQEQYAELLEKASEL